MRKAIKTYNNNSNSHTTLIIDPKCNNYISADKGMMIVYDMEVLKMDTALIIH
jgi:hypothetical protein